MIRNLTMKTTMYYIAGAAFGSIVFNIILNGWRSYTELSRDFIIVFPVSMGIIFVGLYINANGKMEGTDTDGRRGKRDLNDIKKN